ncbi:MAG: PD40 domain-containing protein [Candidatus Omnitrophica bacterium]|nr:PD40 domain-containing protein [Candidatus Omnitrophota bacterium]
MSDESIAYCKLTDDYWQIWTIDPLSKKTTQITTSKQDKRDPIWIEKGQSLAFRTNNGQLFTVNRDGKNEKQILKKYQQINNPHYSNQTNRVVFIRFHPQKQDLSQIYITDLNGENPLLLSDDTKLKYQPRFSANGQQIAFVKTDDKNQYHQIWKMNHDGSNKEQITTQAGFNTLPYFSPDNKFLTFTANTNGNYEIYQVNIKNKQVKNLTNHPGLDTHSVYSPSGEKIAFVSNRSGQRQIWTMNVDGTEAQPLTTGDSEAIEPAWSPF